MHNPRFYTHSKIFAATKEQSDERVCLGTLRLSPGSVFGFTDRPGNSTWRPFRGYKSPAMLCKLLNVMDYVCLSYEETS